MTSAVMGRPVRRGQVRPSTPVISNTQLAMAAVIVAEVMLFAGLVGAFLVFRLGAPVWPPLGLPRLPIAITTLNTIALVASVVPMRQALMQLRADRRREAGRAATWAAALGGLFLVVQGAEWARLVGHGLTLGSSVYGGTFYVLIGCHAVHVLVAVAFVALVTAMVRREVLTAASHAPLEMCATYWYFVVALWLALFPLVYLW